MWGDIVKSTTRVLARSYPVAMQVQGLALGMEQDARQPNADIIEQLEMEMAELREDLQVTIPSAFPQPPTDTLPVT